MRVHPLYHMRRNSMPKWMRQRQRVDYATLLILAISATEIASAFSLDRPSELSPRTKNSVSTIERECDFGHEIQIALQAVRHACTATVNIQEQMDAAGSTITKQDESPVTVADFASQAIILQQLKKEFPNDIFLAEETSATLTPAATDLVRDATNIHDEDRLKECIDIGSSFHDAEQGDPKGRLWCLDPIDGTKGFLRKAQYCLAICLLEDGVPMIGILACPNLPTINDSSKRGCIFLAQRGQGCYELPLEPNSNPPILLTGSSNPESICDVTKARFCVGVEQGFADPNGRCKAMAKLLHGKLDSDDEILHSIRMDSQAKYGIIARGEAEFYVRLPKESHREWIWDVATGALILEEAGGLVTDAYGRTLDFTRGARLVSNVGILGASSIDLHESLLGAFRQT